MAEATRRVYANVPISIDEIRVAGFKSIGNEQAVEIRPLTILAGANSSGKSSMMQPLLLLKQTLEAPYDAGPLLLNGPNVKFTATDQLLSRIGNQFSKVFRVGIRLASGDRFQITFAKEHSIGFEIEKMEVTAAGRDWKIWPKMTETDILKTGIAEGMEEFFEKVPENYKSGHWEIRRNRCFIMPVWEAKATPGSTLSSTGRFEHPAWEFIIPHVIHVPGSRGNPERSYPATAVEATFAGTFEKYTASVISNWASDRLVELGNSLKQLALTGGVKANRLNAVQIELQVGKLPTVSPSLPENSVNIADVGIGVSQALPVVTALLAAQPGQLVYLEEPEIHLHPRAQVAMAQILANAANRGVQVVAETHSSLLLLGVQSLVAEGKLSPDKVKLHWFTRDAEGATTVSSADLDEAGRFGEWPEDFDDVSLKTQSLYLDAAEARLVRR